jgi:hypothetical protein
MALEMHPANFVHAGRLLMSEIAENTLKGLQTTHDLAQARLQLAG